MTEQRSEERRAHVPWKERNTPSRWRSDMIAAATNAARCCGYALAVHGSQVRDLDLLAVPWRETTMSARDVAEAVAEAIDGLLDQDCTEQPYGRLSWAIRPLSPNPADPFYVDLSVFERPSQPEGEVVWMARVNPQSSWSPTGPAAVDELRQRGCEVAAFTRLTDSQAQEITEGSSGGA